MRQTSTAFHFLKVFETGTISALIVSHAKTKRIYPLFHTHLVTSDSCASGIPNLPWSLVLSPSQTQYLVHTSSFLREFFSPYQWFIKMIPSPYRTPYSPLTLARATHSAIVAAAAATEAALQTLVT